MNYVEFIKNNKKLVLVLVLIVVVIVGVFSFISDRFYKGNNSINDEDLSNTVNNKDLTQQNFEAVDFTLPYTPSINLPTTFSETEYKNIENNMLVLSFTSNDFNRYTSILSESNVTNKGSNVEISYTGSPNNFISYYIEWLNKAYGRDSFSFKKIKFEQLSDNGYEPGIPLVEGTSTIDRTFYYLYFNNAPVGDENGDAYYIISFDTTSNKTTVLMPNFFPDRFEKSLMNLPSVTQAVKPFLYEGYGASSVQIKYNYSFSRENFEIIDESGFVSYYMDIGNLRLVPIISKKAKVVGLEFAALEDYFVMGVFK